jgi:lipoprotein-anchoring transpeptidase ErfK/SrfK
LSRITLAVALLLSLFVLLPAHAALAAPRLGIAKSQACVTNNATVHFDWQAMAGATQQWVDLSVQDNNFAAGTFVGYGPLDGKATSVSWSNLEPGTAAFWRVNARTPSGWVTSETGTFVPCGNAAPLAAAKITCGVDDNATVQFRWAPTSLSAKSQYLDISTSDNGFAPGTFYSAGPFSPDASTYSWPNIAGESTHYFRINSLTDRGWQSSKTASMTPCQKDTFEGDGAPPAIPGVETPGERWVLVDTAKQETTAMIGDRPLYTAYVSTGKEGWETPKGDFHILYRVADETMTSSSIGAEEYYVLDHVLYTQYFTNEGHALHLNYWRDDSYFGHIPSSHGCVGMRLTAAEFFWRFAGVGTRVTVI